MPLLTKDDVQGWDIPKLEKEMRDRLADVNSIREKVGGTLTKAAGDDAETVRGHNADLAILGEKLDDLRDLDGADNRFTKLQTYLDTPANGVVHLGDEGRSKFKARDIGGQFIESDSWKQFKESGTKGVVTEFDLGGLFPGYKGIGEIPTDGGFAMVGSGMKALFDSADFPSQPDFRMPPVETLYQPNNIAPLMAQGTTSSSTIRYPVETVVATGAAETNEGATKPEAELLFTPTDEPVRKIAVLLPLTDEALDDEPFLRSYINSRLRLFVLMREDSQLLIGNGTAPNLRGILNRSGINTATSYSIGGANPDQALVDSVFKAAMRVRDAFLEPDAVVMKPATWELAALAKDADRNYLLGGPGAVNYAGGDPAPRLWGLRVVLNAAMPAQSATNKVALVGAFRTAASVIRRSGIDLAVSDSHSTFFAENKVAIRAEERIALAVWRPAGFATVTSAA